MRLARALTAGGTGKLVFDLREGGEKATGLDGGSALVSIRRIETAVDAHELQTLPAVLDAEAATVTVTLTTAQTSAVGPDSTLPLTPQKIIGDVRVEVSASDVRFFGPFAREVRHGETAIRAGQGITSVAHDTTLKGAGTVADPLGFADAQVAAIAAIPDLSDDDPESRQPRRQTPARRMRRRAPTMHISKSWTMPTAMR